MSETHTCTHYCASGSDKELPVEYDEHAECYVQQERCPDCGSLFELYVGIE